MRRRELFPIVGAAAVGFPFSTVRAAATGRYQWAPRSVGAEILSRPQVKSRAGLRSMVTGSDPTAFAEIIEANFALMSPHDLSVLVSSLRGVDLAIMAACYQSATQNSATRPLLLDVMAVRLPASDLSRVAATFGYGDVYSAVERQAPTKLAEFQMLRPPPTDGLPEWFNYGNKTFPQIYNTFLTYPQTSLLGINTAMWASVTLIGVALHESWNFGYAIGSNHVLPFVQQYTPNLYDAIGGTIDQIFEGYRNPYLNLDILQRDSVPSFNLQPIAINHIEQTGGPYSVASEWSYSYLTGSWGSSSCGSGQSGTDGCPIELRRR